MTLTQIEKAFSDIRNTKCKLGPYSRTNRISVSSFCKLHSSGRYYVLVRGHAFAIIDGVVHDFKYGPRRQITWAMRVHLKED